ncbi:hypothetical protein IEQ34_003498 [Dendrobium chrysotoxum]|uniref:Uncharacterized protein n=1 Tax=Dendrobium chrysotoxum TaxID=161865 RepID=A0AAV7H2W7_DENCH|nr:hypothetical protein IEQ34_003498 [Dendrobium chrysotoxum]
MGPWCGAYNEAGNHLKILSSAFVSSRQTAYTRFLKRGGKGTRYMKRLVNELTPTAGINLGEGYQATAVGKAVVDGGTFVSFGKKLPSHVVYDGADRKSIGWDEFAKAKKLKVVNM